MELMVNASVRRHMKERRPVYVRWKGNWYSGEIVRCGPAYVYKVKSVANREMYLLERSQLKVLEDNINSDGDILKPGTDVAYYNQLVAQWERGIIIGHDDCGYAQIRWKLPGAYEEYVNWFDASDISTTPPDMPHSRKLMKPGLFATQESSSMNEDENEIAENNPLLQPGYRKRSQNLAKPKLFARIRSKQAAPISPPVDIPQEDDITDPYSPLIEEFTVEHIDPQSNPKPPKFSGIPPKWLAPTPVYYPCPMYVPVPVLIPHYPTRPPSVSYPFFPGQIFEQNFKMNNSKGIPPHKGAFQLFRIVPKHQSKLMSRQPFSLSGRKLGAYEPKSLEIDRKIDLPPYESIVRSKFKFSRKAKDKRHNKPSSSSDSSEDDELSLYSRRPASAESARSKDQSKSFRPGSGNSTKVRTRASSDLTKSFIMEKKLSDLPSSSPTIKEPDLPIMSTTVTSSKQPSVIRNGTQNSDIIRDEEDVINDEHIPIVSSDSGVRTDTAAYSPSNQQHADCSEDDKTSTTITLNDNAATSVTLSVPTIVIESSSKKQHDTSDSEAFTSDSKVNPSHASIEQYLLGSEQFSDVEQMSPFPREQKSSNGSATELHLTALTSTSSLHSADVLGDITTCRSKRRLLYSASSEPETKPGSSESGSNDESDVLSHKSPEKQKFTTVLPTAVELPEESLPGTPKRQSSHDNDSTPPQSPVTSSNNRMSSFLRSLSPVRLISLRPKKKVTFTT